jgi:hypothetical protein
MAGEHGGVGLAGNDVAEDGHTGDAGHVRDDVVELQVHQGHRLLHALDVGRAFFDKDRAVTHERPDGGDLGVWSEAGSQEPEGVELLEPLAVDDVSLATRYAFDVTCVDEQDFEATLLEDLEERNPIHAGRLHGDGLDAADVEPVGERV